MVFIVFIWWSLAEALVHLVEKNASRGLYQDDVQAVIKTAQP